MSKTTFLFLLLAGLAQAQETLETIEVSSQEQNSFSEYWEENRGTQIYSGKKNTVTDLDEFPALQTNNYRQATSQTPGLLISEIPNEAFAAMTYRGLGDPHESFNVLLLQDGLPVAADMYGYPAHYYAPALPMMDKFQFIRGGAGLLFGPQPGGVVNYLSNPLPKAQNLHGQLNLSYGSYNLITTNNALYGSQGDHSYGIEYYRRQGDGPQRVNSDFFADYLQVRDHVYKGTTKYKIAFNGYNSDHGESGGFSKDAGTNLNTFGDDLGRASKTHDRLRVQRAQLTGGLEKKIDETSQLDVNLWATAYSRFSKRQERGTAPAFGGIYNGQNNQIVEQKYYGYNGEVRYLKNYQAFGNEHTFSGGYMNYNLISPIHTETGPNPDSDSGTTQGQSERQTHVNSFFAENRFAFGKFMATPGIRVENITQSVEERTGSKREEERTENVPLLGLGLSYHVTDQAQFYGNISESYKPLTWTETLPTGVNERVAGDIEEAKTLSTEIGYRGQSELLNWDVSFFHIRYENRLGNLTQGPDTVISNVGAGTHQGVDVATEFKLSNIFDKLRPFGDFTLYANFEYLDADFTQGPQKGKTPQYAPTNLTRVGVIYDKDKKLNIALMGVIVGRHFGDDNNTEEREIPSYTVFDLTADWTFHKNWIAHAGINNLFDRTYFSRVRSDGIIWALDRNYYAGVTYNF